MPAQKGEESMKSITLRVTRRKFRGDRRLHAAYRGKSAYRTAEFLRSAGQQVPEGRYRVRYTVDPEGPLYLLGDDYVTNGMQGAGYVACFLAWLRVPSRTRLSRKVLPW
mgnify:CR=1 FL=1